MVIRLVHMYGMIDGLIVGMRQTHQEVLRCRPQGEAQPVPHIRFLAPDSQFVAYQQGAVGQQQVGGDGVGHNGTGEKVAHLQVHVYLVSYGFLVLLRKALDGTYQASQGQQDCVCSFFHNVGRLVAFEKSWEIHGIKDAGAIVFAVDYRQSIKLDKKFKMTNK